MLVDDITREMFNKFEEIRDSGDTNMFDTRRVVELSNGFLEKEDVICIMNNWEFLCERYAYKD